MDIQLLPAPEWTEKVWGSTKCVHKGQNFEVHELYVNKGGFSSRHRHRKWNRFHVMTGKIRVEQFKREENGDLTLTVDRILEAGDFYEVGPEEIHRFVATEDSHLLEVYWTTDINPEDIERFDEGGIEPETIIERAA